MANPEMGFTQFTCAVCGMEEPIESDETATEAVVRHFRDDHDLIE